MDDLERCGWIKVGVCSYRHYCGARVTKRGRFWTAKTVAGTSTTNFTQVSQAAKFLEENDPLFWTCGRSASHGIRGGLVITGGCLPDENRGDEVFAFSLSKGEGFSEFFKKAFQKYLFGQATCAKCSLPMTELLLRDLSEFNGYRLVRNVYIACSCGHPVWRLDSTLLSTAERAMDQGERLRRRKRDLVEAGGKHGKKEIREILDLQRNRCIYCNTEFTSEIRPTKDHFFPVAYGGSDWALNIVIACRRCNSRRSYIPFRTYCKLLSQTQNQRILMNLSRRLLALNLDCLSEEALLSFHLGLAQHNTRHYRYLALLSASSTARRNAANNRLLPRTGTLILKSASKGLKRAS